MIRLVYLISLTLCLGSVGTRATGDNVLVYVYQDDCGACMKFDKEVADIYPKSAEGAALPLAKISLEEWRDGAHPYKDCAVSDVFGTPTFIQLSQCTEIDRITGYSSDELFWLGIARMSNALAATD